MIFKLKTWYKHFGNSGSSRAYLTLRIETDNTDFRDQVYAAIKDAMVAPKPSPDQKPSAMGFHHPGQEDF